MAKYIVLILTLLVVLPGLPLLALWLGYWHFHLLEEAIRRNEK